MNKICNKCKTEKNITKFSRDKSKKDNRCSMCKTCRRKYCKKYIKNNQKKIKIYRKMWYQEHKKEMSDYRKNNRKKAQIYEKKYYKINKKSIKIHKKVYCLSADGIYMTLKNNAKNKKMKFSLIKKDFINWYNNQKQECHYCMRSLKEIKQDIIENKKYKGRLSIDRKDNNKGYTLNNIVLACRRCNYIKGDYITEEKMKKIGKFLYK
jgi:hypothetical protein